MLAGERIEVVAGGEGRGGIAWCQRGAYRRLLVGCGVVEDMWERAMAMALDVSWALMIRASTALGFWRCRCLPPTAIAAEGAVAREQWRQAQRR